jgi:hypothetical protein
MPHGGPRRGAGRPKGRRNPETADAQHVTAQHADSSTTGHRRSRKRPPGEDAKRLARAQQALDLRIAGATYRQIAAQLAVNERTAYYDVQQALARAATVARTCLRASPKLLHGLRVLRHRIDRIRHADALVGAIDVQTFALVRFDLLQDRLATM